MPIALAHVCFWGEERKWRGLDARSLNDPNRTWTLNHKMSRGAMLRGTGERYDRTACGAARVGELNDTGTSAGNAYFARAPLNCGTHPLIAMIAILISVLSVVEFSEEV